MSTSPDHQPHCRGPGAAGQVAHTGAVLACIHCSRRELWTLPRLHASIHGSTIASSRGGQPLGALTLQRAPRSWPATTPPYNSAYPGVQACAVRHVTSPTTPPLRPGDTEHTPTGPGELPAPLTPDSANDGKYHRSQHSVTSVVRPLAPRSQRLQRSSREAPERARMSHPLRRSVRYRLLSSSCRPSHRGLLPTSYFLLPTSYLPTSCCRPSHRGRRVRCRCRHCRCSRCCSRWGCCRWRVGAWQQWMRGRSHWCCCYGCCRRWC